VGRKKRSQVIAARAALKPTPLPKVPAEVMGIDSAFCPMCGKSISQDRAIKAGYVTIDHIPYFDSIAWDENKPFGMKRYASGRGSFSQWEYIQPHDNVPLFQAVKQRFLAALREWLKKKWLSPGEIASILEEELATKI